MICLDISSASAQTSLFIYLFISGSTRAEELSCPSQQQQREPLIT